MKYNRNEMAVGSRNILMITCARSHESRCTSEAYQLLDGLFEMDDYIPSLIQGGGQGGGRLSSEEQMLEEIKFIKNGSKRPFSIIKGNLGDRSCMIFLQVTFPNSSPYKDIVQLVTDGLFSPLTTAKSRFSQRVIPISLICRANITDIREGFKTILNNENLEKNNKDQSIKKAKTYSIMMESRLSNQVQKNVMIEVLADLISSFNPMIKVDLSSPDITFMVQVWKGLAGLSILPSYLLLKKYNLQEFSKIL